MGNAQIIPKTAAQYKNETQAAEARQIYLAYLNCHKLIQENFVKTGHVNMKCPVDYNITADVADLLEKDGFNAKPDEFQGPEIIIS